MGKKEFMKGALLGALIVTAVALYTPKKTGKERQEEFKIMHPELSAKILEAVGKMKVMSKEKYDDVVEKAVMEYGKKKNCNNWSQWLYWATIAQTIGKKAYCNWHLLSAENIRVILFRYYKSN